MIDINQLEQCIKRQENDTQSYPLMVIANAGRISSISKNLRSLFLFRYGFIRSL
jgi:hypothetical protein